MNTAACDVPSRSKNASGCTPMTVKPILRYSAAARSLPSMYSSSSWRTPISRATAIISENIAVPIPSPQNSCSRPMATAARWCVFWVPMRMSWQLPAMRPSTVQTIISRSGAVRQPRR